ncbi:MAG: phosphoribosylformylglycinamidine synthase subunit PurQ [Alphaproteobacteria bacterium]|nr:phosphoribosylformylglycinamidine synthase subunit PurQ [Alphaproteobacteria bacterium]
MSAQVIVLSGYGLNCEEETLFAFRHVGLGGRIVHINDVIENPKMLESYQILCVPGGFSYGDDTGSGNAFAQKMRLALWDDLKKFVERDTLTLGICNGCQILTNLGLVPAFDQNYGVRDIAVTYNKSARYQCRWIDLKVAENNSPWLSGIESMHIPVAHGEGRFMMEDQTLEKLRSNKQIAAQYIIAEPSAHPKLDLGSHEADPDLRQDARIYVLAEGQFPYNPNGSIGDIAAITDETGKVLVMMPHPERGMFTWQRDDYMEIKDAAQRAGQDVPEESDGLAIFKNAALYFEGALKKSA